jgi:hypothetical protein
LRIKYLHGAAVEFTAPRGHNRAMFQQLGITGPSSCVVSVIMEHVVLTNQWASERWQAKGVVCDGATAASGERTIVSREDTTQLLFPGCSISLNREEAEGYFLNLSSPQPRIFVLWRLHEERARPDMLTVSYHEGSRWMDSEENVDSVALPNELRPWLAQYVAEHYKPEPRRKPRYASSKDKGRMGNY